MTDQTSNPVMTDQTQTVPTITYDQPLSQPQAVPAVTQDEPSQSIPAAEPALSPPTPADADVEDDLDKELDDLVVSHQQLQVASAVADAFTDMADKAQQYELDVEQVAADEQAEQEKDKDLFTKSE